MIRKGFIAVAFILGGLGAKAQNQLAVTLEETCDTTQVDNWLLKSRTHFEKNRDSVFYFINRALQQSYHCNFNERIVTSLVELSAYHFGNNPDEAIRYAHLALQEYEKRSKLTKRRQNIIYKAYNVIAKAFETKGMIDSSAYYYYVLNDVIEKGIITDPEYAVSVYSQLALFWLNTNWDINSGYIEPTRHFIEKARAAEPGLKDSSVQAYTSYMLQGAYYICTKNYDSSRYFYLEYLRQRQRIGTSNVTWEAATFLNVSETFLEENRPNEAIGFIDSVLAIKVRLAAFPRYLTMAQLYLSRALYQQKKYIESIQAYHNAFAEVSQQDFFGKELIEAIKIVGNAYEAMGMTAKAMEYKNTYIQMHDSLMKQDKLDMMNRLQIKYRVAEKDKELAQQQLIITQNQSDVRKKNFLIAGISVIALFMTIVFVLWRRNSRNKQDLQQKEINSFQQKMEIANLNATIEGAEKERTRIARELHDGIGGLLAAAKMNFETVKGTYHLHNKQDFTDGLKLLSEASAELRKTAHNMMPEILLQEGLVEAVAYFCQTVSRNSNTRIRFQVAGTVQKFGPALELSIYRIIQELVHNILKHARATEALVQMGFSDQLFDLSIEDNGIGISEEAKASSNGMGLKSIEDRVRSIHGKINIQNLPGHGAGVYLEVPLETAQIVNS